jgi:hypothetical protein
MKRLLLGAAAFIAASSAFANIPPAYLKHLPPERQQGNVAFLTGGSTPDEEAAVKRAAQEWPLEVVFYESDGGTPRKLDNMPVVVTDAGGKVVFDGVTSGPVMLLKLPKGRYTVSTKWDAWSFSQPVTLGDDRQRVVFDWKREGASANVG